MNNRFLSPVLSAILLGLLAFLTIGPASAEEGETPELLLILDASGSMWGQIDGENKIVIARRVVAELIGGLPADSSLGLVAYGHRREGDCADIETVVSPGPLDAATFSASVNGLNPKGKTPITAALEHTFELLDGPATVILLSDGLETCDGDPCEAVRKFRETGAELLTHVVGFDVGKEDVSQFECIAQAGGGLFLEAENAEQLAGALETAVALEVGEPAGRLVVKATANGELQDVSIWVTRVEDGEQIAGSRTYTSPETNPREIPLPDGVYDVEIKAVGVSGAPSRRYEGVEIVEGGVVEKELDFSPGELAVLVERNGELSDATVRAFDGETQKQVAAGRTYRSANSNPRVLNVLAGKYDVEVKSVEIAGSPNRLFEGVEVRPGERTTLEHAFESGTISLGVMRGDELVDAVVRVHDTEGRQVDGSRTYTSASSNPSHFEVVPGTYTLKARVIGGEQYEAVVEVTSGGTVEHKFELSLE